MIQEGEAAPSFTLKDSHNIDVSLEDYRGKIVVVYFYPRDNTPGCTKEACGFRDLWSEVQATNTIVLGVSPDGAKSHQTFCNKYNLPFPLLSDPDREVMTQYGAYGEKTMYGMKVIGVIRSTVVIDAEGKVAKHWRRVARAADHPAKVLEFLQSKS